VCSSDLFANAARTAALTFCTNVFNGSPIFVRIAPVPVVDHVIRLAGTCEPSSGGGEELNDAGTVWLE
jgi:hypothetical protein